jgi:DNA helicase-2/ATP-dependent DNA helicase PcrA
MAIKLNPQQKEAVEHEQGPLLVIAGAGSGKTRVLTERLARLIEKDVAQPQHTLTVTFTNKAANEIKERVLKRLSEKQIYPEKLPWMGTFHSIAVKILRREAQKIGLQNSFSIFDSKDQLRLVKDIIKDLRLSEKTTKPKAILSGISNAKNELLTPKKFAKQVNGYYEENVAEVYEVYQKTLKDSNALDFDDLLMYTVFLFQENEQSQSYYQNLFKYILIDEFQDTNHAQYTMVKILSDPQKNICVVGDDDQSIYSWRGANVRNILDFEKDFPDVKVIKLEQNYRSTQKILDAGNCVVKKIGSRQSKNLWTDAKSGNDITVYEAAEEKDEAYFVVEKIRELQQEQKMSLNDMAILYRMNAQSRALEETFIKTGIPYKIIGNVRFYSRKEIKDVLAYLRILSNSSDTLSLTRIINVPTRGIGKKTLEDLMLKSQVEKLDPVEYLLTCKDLNNKSLQAFQEILLDLKDYASNHTLAELIKYLLHKTKYIELFEDDTEENLQRKQNLQELINVASKFNNGDTIEALQKFLEEVALFEAQDELANVTAEPQVTLMTIHSAKGLEFENVFVVGVEEGIFPMSRSFESQEQMDEERRLAYVAITRAKQNLFLSYANYRTLYGRTNMSAPSRFLNDIDTEIINFIRSTLA